MPFPRGILCIRITLLFFSVCERHEILHADTKEKFNQRTKQISCFRFYSNTKCYVIRHSIRDIFPVVKRAQYVSRVVYSSLYVAEHVDLNKIILQLS